MSKSKENLNKFFKNPRNRLMFISVTAIAVIFIGGGVFLVKNSSNNSSSQPAGASVVGTPTVTSATGVSESPTYNQKLNEENQKRTENALQTGNTYIPTPVNNTSFNNRSPLDNMDNTEPKEPEEQKPVWIKKEELREESCPYPQLGKIISARTYEQNTAEEMMRNFSDWSLKSNNCVMPQPQQPVVNTVQQPAMKYGRADAALIASLSGFWSNKPSRSEFNYSGQRNEEPENVNNGNDLNQNSNQVNNSTNNPAKEVKIPVDKAGTVYYAVLETPINSDEQSPVLAKIMTGPLKGARIIGGFKRVDKKVVVEFTRANVPGYPTSIAINAVAVDADKGNTNLAESVDNHYFLRYGVLLASAFLSGYSDAIARQNTTVTNSPLGGTTVTQGELPTSQLNKQAFGQVGKELANEARSDFRNIPPTVKVNEDGKGTAIGVLLMQDLVL